ncbi:hypothetical protein CTB91_04179 [Dickeya solani]|uniref:Sialidase domain-containing protein n=1 Tax=Dickeya solani D s0432-1 TaxID=1231725 RepID=A0AAV3K9Q2_9GAMM|nr:hypothetical protein A4U42_08380 [Dickeya solani IPO 2222]AUC42760.1 hypothetical protein D083_2411 [Dickeya solani RNS 08.23.3.1.A]AUH09234.1 hypothetical protein BJD21_12655 [Dickeya solani D s0432-1]AUH13206.1 hypothetical protein BJJ98_12620 [Dickeya solani]AYQ49901.1 hypothetical protein CTB91_04179 [Dickeya solani]
MRLTTTTQQFVLPGGHDCFGNCHASTVAALPDGQLRVACSADNGEHWESGLDLEQEPGEFFYPAIIADGDTLHVTYTWNRKNIVYCALIFSG